MAEIADVQGPPVEGRLPLVEHPLPAGYVRIGVAREIAPTLRQFDLDPDPIIKAAGLDPRLFDDCSSAITYQALGRLCALSVARTRCPHFGHVVGCSATILSLGVLGRLMLHSDTFGQALHGLVTNLSVQDRIIVPSIDVQDNTVTLAYAVYRSEIEGVDQITDGAMACTVNAFRTLLGNQWAPAEVLMARAKPVDVEPYRRHFRAPIRFNQEMAALVFPSRWLEARIEGADPLLRVLLENRVKQLKGAQGSEFSDDLRRLLRMKLTSNRCSSEYIAKMLAMHRRTLNRRLKEDGMGFRDISNEIRFVIARQLLLDTDLPLGQISAALDYSEAGAFSRAFRRWSGETPKAWRSAHRVGGKRSPSESPGSPLHLEDKGSHVDEEEPDRDSRIALQSVPTEVATGSMLCGS